MSYNKNIHHKSSIRLNGHDYSSAGYYFITICVKDRECIFGNIIDGKMNLSSKGQIVHNEWLNTQNLRKNVILDEFIVMPNHIHMIIEIIPVVGLDVVEYPVGIDCNQPLRDIQSLHKNQSRRSAQPYHAFGPQSNNLFAIIRGFKGSTTKQINHLIGNPENGTIWQSRFYDHVIKSDRALENIRNYIKNNPKNWIEDIENIMQFQTLPQKHELHKYYQKLFK